MQRQMRISYFQRVNGGIDMTEKQASKRAFDEVKMIAKSKSPALVGGKVELLRSREAARERQAKGR